MRDHHAVADALRKRHIRRAGRLPAVNRIFLFMAARPLASVRNFHRHIHAHVAVTVPVTRHNRISASTVLRIATFAAGDIRRGRPVPTSESPAGPRRMASADIVPAVSRRAISPIQAELTTVASRRETVVSRVALVVPKPTAPEIPDDEPKTHWPPTRLGDQSPLRPLEAPSAGPTPAELATITNHVLTAIDSRLIAHNERMGRG
jgi:hypothetical protein